MRPRGTAEQLQKRRREAIQLLNEGKSLSETAKAVKASISSVWRWREAYREGGWEGLRSRPVPGRPSKLSLAQKEKLLRILEGGPLAAGYKTDLWTLKRVAEVIRREFRVRHHPCHVWWILVRLGWSCQKPERRARERDEEEIERWRRERWPHIKKRPKQGPEHRFS
jgi:transposase